MNTQVASTFSRREKLIYTAALLDGEGIFYAARLKSQRNWEYTQIYVACVMTDREPLETLEFFWGGNINGPYLSKDEKRKPYFKWALNRVDSLNLCRGMVSLVCPRRLEQINVLLTLDKEYPYVDFSIRHGVSGYRYRKCRCEICRAAFKKYAHDNYERRKVNQV